MTMLPDRKFRKYLTYPEKLTRTCGPKMPFPWDRGKKCSLENNSVVESLERLNDLLTEPVPYISVLLIFCCPTLRKVSYPYRVTLKNGRDGTRFYVDWSM